MVFLDLVKMFGDNLHQHEPYKSLRWDLTDCKICLHLVYPVSNRQVCAKLVLLYLTLNVPAKSPFGSFQGLAVNEELSFTLCVYCLVELFFSGSQPGSGSGGS